MKDDETRKGVDRVSLIYIIGGVPALVGFIVVLFAFARSCNIPA